MERRTFGGVIELRDGDKPKIAGHAAVFFDGTPSTEYELWQGTFERIMPGSFDKSVSQGEDVRALFNHDVNQVLGRTKSGTLSLAIDARGLRYEITPPNTNTGKDVTESIRRGDVTGSSFSFAVTDEQWVKRDGKRIREIRGVKLFDVGPVVFPAYEGASSAVRADGDAADARASLARHEADEQAEGDTFDAELRLLELGA